MHMIFSFMLSSILFNSIKVILIVIVHVLIIDIHHHNLVLKGGKGGGGLDENYECRVFFFRQILYYCILPLNATYEILSECSIDTS